MARMPCFWVCCPRWASPQAPSAWWLAPPFPQLHPPPLSTRSSTHSQYGSRFHHPLVSFLFTPCLPQRTSYRLASKPGGCWGPWRVAGRGPARPETNSQTLLAPSLSELYTENSTSAHYKCRLRLMGNQSFTTVENWENGSFMKGNPGLHLEVQVKFCGPQFGASHLVLRLGLTPLS